MSQKDATEDNGNNDLPDPPQSETNGILGDNMLRWVSWAVALYFLLEILLTSWSVQGQYLVNGNISWLLMSAERFLNGGSYLNDFYETNPPLSILIYTPHILLAHAIDVPITSASYILSLILTLISGAITYSIIRFFPDMSEEQKATFGIAYILSMTLATTVFFSEREHIMMLGLVPFMLLQYASTYKISVPRALAIPVFIIGTMCILIKPHYGILPAVLFLHRLKHQKNFHIYRDLDFVILALGTLGYIATIFTLFPDYVNTILPDTLSLYDSDKDFAGSWNAVRRYFPVYLVLYFMEYTGHDLKKTQKRLLMFLYTCCILCLIPYWVQMKGYYNHIIPLNGFFIIAFALSLSFRAEHMIRKLRPLHIAAPILIISTIVSMTMPLTREFPKKQEIPDLPLGKFLTEKCPAPCNFLTFHSDIEILNPTTAYMDGYTHTSRFPTLWFIPKILTGLQSKDAEERKHYKALQKKYAGYFTEDLKRHKPAIILIATGLQVGETVNFDLIDFFSVNDELTEVLYRDYEYIDKFEYDRAKYFTGTSISEKSMIVYDVYILRD